MNVRSCYKAPPPFPFMTALVPWEFCGCVRGDPVGHVGGWHGRSANPQAEGGGRSLCFWVRVRVWSPPPQPPCPGAVHSTGRSYWQVCSAQRSIRRSLILRTADTAHPLQCTWRGLHTARGMRTAHAACRPPRALRACALCPQHCTCAHAPMWPPHMAAHAGAHAASPPLHAPRCFVRGARRIAGWNGCRTGTKRQSDTSRSGRRRW